MMIRKRIKITPQSASKIRDDLGLTDLELALAQMQLDRMRERNWKNFLVWCVALGIFLSYVRWIAQLMGY